MLCAGYITWKGLPKEQLRAPRREFSNPLAPVQILYGGVQCVFGCSAPGTLLSA